MSTIRVTITVETEGGIRTASSPITATWVHNHSTHDSPRFYGHEARKALAKAAELAAEGLPAVDLDVIR
jgi:hypothetical protein